MQIIPISQLTPLFETEGISTNKSQETGAAGIPFSDILQESMKTLQETRKVSAQDAYDLALGNTDDIAAIQIHSAQATAALELTVQVASRAVSAYKEILQMQI